MKNTFRCVLSRIFVLLLVLSLVPFTTLTVNAETEQSYAAQNTATGVQYTDVMEALTEAEAGQTVVLLRNAEGISVLTVMEERTLDLNGFALTARYVSCYGCIEDNSDSGSGLLKVSGNRFLIQEKNPQIPVLTDGGYRFLQVLGFNEAVLNGGTKYAFQPLLEGGAAELLSAGQKTSGVTITVQVSWAQANGRRTQTFVYSDEQVATYLNSYVAATGKYSKMFSLNLRNAENFTDLRFEAVVASSAGVKLGVGDIPDESVGDVVADENNQITQDVTLNNDQATAVVAAGTLVEQGATKVALTTTKLDSTTSNVTLATGEQMVSMDVHVAGVAADNTVPVIVTINELTLNGLNQGNIALYHVENGETVAMTRVYAKADLDTHNEYYYDIATGTITVALANFSEVTVVAEEEKAWEGKFDYSWYDANKESLEIHNADQLAAFGAIVGGMNGQTRDDFADKTVTLMSDINLGDAEDDRGTAIFYPIGYYNSEGTYEKTNKEISSSVAGFRGTFDGNGHTIANFYQNTWEMKGDDSYYDKSLQYYNDAMGLFGWVVDGTVKNLTVDNFSSDGEFTPTGVIAAYAENATFENIAITNCNPRVYNTGNGGIIGIGGRSNDNSGQKLILKNITVDSTNKISALWGSWDVACGGLVGMFRGNAAPGNGTIHFENCHVAAEIDVYNDVCANYQYYQYRYAGMLIGSVRHNETVDGKVVPVTNGITASDTTVLIGNWKNDYYCELVANSLASYTHDYQFSRLEHITSLSEIWDGANWTKAGNFILVNENGVAITEGADAGCYHIVKDGDGFKRHVHEESGTQDVDINGDGVKENVLVENNQRIYLPFPEQLFTGYSWGVSHIALNNFEGVEARIVGESCDKFNSVASDTYEPGTAVNIGELFQSVTNPAVSICNTNVQVFVSPADEKSTVTGTYVANISDWTQGKLSLSGEGEATITITDYYFCNPKTITVTVKVTKTDATVTEAPVANELTYTGSAQALVSGGDAEGGKLVYSTAADGTFTETVPTGTNAGEYTVYYKVLGDESHFDTDPVLVQVTIAKAVASCTVTPAETWTYDGTEQRLVNTSNVKGESVVYRLSEDDEFTNVIPTTANAGTYTVYYKVLGNDNYTESGVKSVTVTVNKAESAVDTAPVVKQELTYNKEEQPLVDAGTATGGEIWYKVEKKQAVATFALTRTVVVDEDGFSPEIPTAKNAGTYIVYYKVKGDDNHNDSAVSQVEVTVNKAKPEVTLPEVNVTYGDTLEDAVLSVPEGNEAGTLTWNDSSSTSVGDAGTNSFTATFTPEDEENYETVEVTVTVAVAKADPIYTVPTGLKANYGTKLPAIDQYDGFAWQDRETVVTQTGEYPAIYTPADTENYNTVNVSVRVEALPVEKFETKFTGDFLYRVGNQNTVTLGSLFKAKDGAQIGTVSVTIEAVGGTVASGTYTSNATWTDGTIQFSGTGVVKVTITDNNYCTPTELYLEVVDAVNATTATSATANNVVLLNDVGFSSVEVKNGYTLYGNGFTMTCSSDQAALDMGYAFVTLENGTLDNVRVICPNFTLSALFQKNYKLASNTSDGSRYYNVKSAVIMKGSSKIVNSYVAGGRAAIYATSGTPILENSTVYGGAAANIHVGAVVEIVLRDMTLIQEPIESTDKTKTIMGLSVVAISDSAGNTPSIRLEGTLEQYAWAHEGYAVYVPSDYTSLINMALSKEDYVHSVTYADGETHDSINLGFAFIPDEKAPNGATVSDNRTDKDEKTYDSVVINTAYIYSRKKNANAAVIDGRYEAYVPTAQGYIAPVLEFLDTETGVREFKTEYDSVKGWSNTLVVNLDQCGGSYQFSFSNLVAKKYGKVQTYTVTDEDGNAVADTVLLNKTSGYTYILTVQDTTGAIIEQVAQDDVIKSEIYFTITATRTDIEKPSLVASNYEAGICVASSYGGTWHGAAPALEGLEIRYYSNVDGDYITINLAEYTPEVKGQLNGTNTTYSIRGGDFELTLTGGQVHSGNSVYAMPVCVNADDQYKLYFVAANSKGLVNSGNSARTIPVSYSFKADSHDEALTFSHTWSVAENKDEQYKYSDFCNGTLTKLEEGCLVEGTLITLADGTQKLVEDLTVGDMVLAFNHVSGEFEAAPIIFNNHADAVEPDEYDVLYLEFANDEKLKIVQAHGLFDLTLMQYVYIDYENYQDYIGHEFYYAGNDGTVADAVILESAYIEKETVRIFCPVSYFHMNSVANGFLNTPNIPGDITGLVNYFEYDPDLKYNEEAMQRDIETYGLYAYEDFSEYISEEAYNSSPSVYLKVAVGKGMITYEQIIDVINYLLAGSLIQ